MTELHIACMGRDEEKVRNLASDITSLSTPDQYGITAVHYATFQPENLPILVNIAEQRDTCMLSLLVREDGRGNTPLHYAAASGCTESVSYYKSVNIHNSDGDTPLHLSIKSSYCHSGPVREILLHESCNSSTVNTQNETPLHIVSQYGKPNIAELFAEKCSQEDIKLAVEAHFFLHQAVATSQLRFVLVLLQVPGCNINEFNSNEVTPLHVACRSDFEVFKQLIIVDSRYDLNAQNKNGLTALHITIASDQCVKYRLLIINVDCNPSIVCSDRNVPLMIEKILSGSLKVLLKHLKCNPNMTIEEGDSALHLDVTKHSVPSVTCLLQHRIDPNLQNHSGNTPLHEVVVTQAPIDIMKSLIYHENIMMNKEENHALHLAVREHSILCATCLLQHERIVPKIQNHSGYTPLHEATNTGTPIEIMKCLIRHKKYNPCTKNGNERPSLQIASENGLNQYFIALVESGKCSQEEIKDAASRFRYLLHHAVSLNDINLLQMLQSVCDVNEANQDGEIPLHIACRQCSIEVVQVLVADKRCDLNVQSNTGETTLHIAVYSELHSVQKVQSILHSDRCNPNIANNERHTPLNVAVRNMKFQIAANLLKHPKCNPNTHDLRGNTPLHMALTSNTSLPNIQPFLIHKDIDLSIQKREGNTPLYMKQSKEEIIRAIHHYMMQLWERLQLMLWKQSHSTRSAVLTNQIMRARHPFRFLLIQVRYIMQKF